MELEPILLKFDRLAGGRAAGVKADVELVQHPRTRRTFTWIIWLLAVELVIGVAALVVAVVLWVDGTVLAFPVWMRILIVLAMTATLFYFAWRAQVGYRWAYSRLRLFSKIFPVVTLVMAAIPGLFPFWMVTEQIIYSLILIGIADFLDSDHMRAVFRKPETA
ncbi:hypothetical protein [Agromyces sp. PvR057]|uniref:hypothetical protein n=1 Tax=Agromyces sp. PvR057 TaxID=3156403 RepID=UPI000E249F7B